MSIATCFSVVAPAPAVPSYLDFLGSFAEAKPGNPGGGGQTSGTIPVASVAITDRDSIFVGLAVNSNDGPPTVAGWTGIDNLGNVYTPQSGPVGGTAGGLTVGLMACLDPAPGTLTSITISWTDPLKFDGPIAMRAHRFRDIGDPEASLVETLTLGSWSSSNYVLKQASSAGAIGIAVMGIRTQGTTGDPYVATGGVYLGATRNPPASISDSSGVTVMMAYDIDVPAGGIGQSFLTFDGSRALVHVGKVYKRRSGWPS